MLSFTLKKWSLFFYLPLINLFIFFQPKNSYAIETITIEALPFNPSLSDSQHPTIVLEGEKLKKKSATSLGETLGELPGIHNASFGSAVGRPVIRGLHGGRIEVLQNGSGTFDLSTLSPDHATTIADPLLAERIEVLKGPMTLLYGGHAIGGTINVINDRLPQKKSDGGSGSMEYRHETASNGNIFAAKAQMSHGSFTGYIDTFKRWANDYRIPGYSDHSSLLAEFHEDDELPKKGVLENSDVDFQGGSLGFSYEKENIYWGISLSYLLGNYGLPGHSHAHHHEEEHEDEEHEHEHDAAEDPARLDLNQVRVDSLLRIAKPFTHIDSIKWNLSFSDYEHAEKEGEEIAALFNNDVFDSRLEIQPVQVHGWKTLVGLQLTHRDLAASGEEAFVPDATQLNVGLFSVLQKNISNWELNAGARYDFQRTNVSTFASQDDCSFVDSNDQRFNGLSTSMGATYRFTDAYQASLILGRSVRLPSIEELYACGEHLAANAFERGDTTLDPETAYTADLTFKKILGPITGDINLFYYAINNYIYADFSSTENETEELNQLQTIQRNATFYGGEFDISFPITRQAWGQLQGNFFTDYVRAKTKKDNLPRISPWRYGFSIDYRYKQWQADIGMTIVADQTKNARLETETDGYTLLEAGFSFTEKLGSTNYQIFLRGENLLNEEIRHHTSFIKDRAPMPGRGLTVGFRLDF